MRRDALSSIIALKNRRNELFDKKEAEKVEVYNFSLYVVIWENWEHLTSPSSPPPGRPTSHMLMNITFEISPVRPQGLGPKETWALH